MIFAMLKNTATGRFHPILFRPAPMPSVGSGNIAGQMRYRSYGHNTKGFDTEEEARSHVAEACAKNGFSSSPVTAEWDGEGVPAMTMWFPVVRAEGTET